MNIAFKYARYNPETSLQYDQNTVTTPVSGFFTFHYSKRTTHYFHLKDIPMNNNDILRRIRYIFDFSDSKMMAVFDLAGDPATREQISDWLKKDDDPAYRNCTDRQLAIFLNGLITDKRGKKEGPQPDPERQLNNNIIFRKLKIALNLKAENILEIMTTADLQMSKHELSAFFRRPGHKNYRVCNDQILRKFLQGVQLQYRTKRVDFIK
jgi:uncharacterized protein YehS (DUF1456 family)